MVLKSANILRWRKDDERWDTLLDSYYTAFSQYASSSIFETAVREQNWVYGLSLVQQE
jgi:hypothetical protein